MGDHRHPYSNLLLPPGRGRPCVPVGRLGAHALLCQCAHRAHHRQHRVPPALRQARGLGGRDAVMRHRGSHRPPRPLHRGGMSRAFQGGLERQETARHLLHGGVDFRVHHRLDLLRAHLEGPVAGHPSGARRPEDRAHPRNGGAPRLLPARHPECHMGVPWPQPHELDLGRQVRSGLLVRSLGAQALPFGRHLCTPPLHVLPCDQNVLHCQLGADASRRQHVVSMYQRLGAASVRIRTTRASILAHRPDHRLVRCDLPDGEVEHHVREAQASPAPRRARGLRPLRDDPLDRPLHLMGQPL
mmetsp:Transcript_86449/g.249419  ORF Transcript_86449/g.249419 Transcript_86449/m.249419 type:complete len:300 (+) Transcript_86449:704-1603(+)